MKKLYRLFLLIVLFVTCFTPPAAVASQEKAFSHPFLASNQTNNISEQAAVTIAKQRINGRVLAVSRKNNAYRIKILSDKGTVHIISVNSNDGSVSPAH